MKNLATEEGYESFVVPDDVGGRFSVLTAVGLLPIAVSGADIAKLMEGAASMRELCLDKDFADNDSMKLSGGNSFTERAKVKIRKVFSRQQLI